jgi:hypothetical protein
LAWFNASCMGYSCPPVSAALLRPRPEERAYGECAARPDYRARVSKDGAARIAASCFETAAFGGLLSMRSLKQHAAERGLSQ